MSDDSQSTTDSATEKDEDDLAAFLTEGLGVSVLTGVAVVPLILPGGNGNTKFLLSKFQIQGADSQAVFEGLVPLDVLTSLSLNLVKACNTAFQNVGEVRNENLMFIQIGDLRKALTDCMNDVGSLLKILEVEDQT